MVFDGAFANDEAAGDLFVGCANSYQAQDFDFARADFPGAKN